MLLSGSGNLLGSGGLDGCLFCRSGKFCGGCSVGRGGFCCGDGGSGADKAGEEVLGSERPPELLSPNSPQAVSKKQSRRKKSRKDSFQFDSLHQILTINVNPV